MVSRSIQQHPFWSGEKSSRGQAMVDLLCLQSFTSHQVHICGHVIDLDRGDFAASVRFLANRWGWSLRKTASFLARLEVDKFLVKKRNGTGNGSPSVYHIVDEGIYAPEGLPEGNGSGNAEDTVAIRLGDKENKGKKGKKGNTTGGFVALDDFLSSFSPNDQDLIRQTLSVMAATPKSRLSTQAAKNSLASELTRFPQSAVIAGCRAYLEQDCATQGKSESYFLGIVKRISSTHKGNQNTPTFQPLPKSEVSLAIERAQANLGQEQQK